MRFCCGDADKLVEKEEGWERFQEKGGEGEILKGRTRSERRCSQSARVGGDTRVQRRKRGEWAEGEVGGGPKRLMERRERGEGGMRNGLVPGQCKTGEVHQLATGVLLLLLLQGVCV